MHAPFDKSSRIIRPREYTVSSPRLTHHDDDDRHRLLEVEERWASSGLCGTVLCRGCIDNGLWATGRTDVVGNELAGLTCSTHANHRLTSTIDVALFVSDQNAMLRFILIDIYYANEMMSAIRRQPKEVAKTF
uniref:Uncharacterized protein n=1 Tax=Plectus sambesii TaxID=2011161 RepID=A0A914WSN8_9BILA